MMMISPVIQFHGSNGGLSADGSDSWKYGG
jgi:hypothetical protein